MSKKVWPKSLKKILSAPKLTFLLLVFGLVVGLGAVLLRPNHPPRPRIGKVPLVLEIADEPHEQAAGLSNRTELGQNHGMLFVFERPGQHGFWMKDTLIPLDILWLDENYQIVQIIQNVQPESYPTTFINQSPAKYVLEVNAGFCAQHQIAVGDMLKL